MVEAKSKLCLVVLMNLLGFSAVISFYYFANKDELESLLGIQETKPSYDTYLKKLKKHNPSCDCSKMNIAFETVASFDISLDPVCQGFKKFKECRSISTSSCGQFWLPLMELGDHLCTVSEELIHSQLAELNSTMLTTPTLLSEAVFDSYTATAARSHLQRIRDSIRAPLDVNLALTEVERPVLWYQNNLVEMGGVNLSAIDSFYLPCVQDYSITKRYKTYDYKYCTPFGIFEAIGADYFRDPSALTGNLVSAVIANATAVFFVQSQFENVTLSQIAHDGFIFSNQSTEGVKTTPRYQDYYNLCEPSVCKYTILRPTKPSDYLTIGLALIGGVTAIVQFVVETLIPALCSKERDARKTEAEMAKR